MTEILLSLLHSKWPKLCFVHSECNRVNWYVKPIALRRAKTPLSFGRLECNRVKPQLNNNKYAKFDDYRYHTFRSGLGTTDDKLTYGLLEKK